MTTKKVWIKSEGEMSNQCPHCGSIRNVCVSPVAFAYLCLDCGNVFRKQPNQTVFQQLIASPEVLAPKLVYCVAKSWGDLYWMSTVIGEKKFPSYKKAIAATIAELNAVAEKGVERMSNNTSKYACPKCGSPNIQTERRPDGFHHCTECWHSWKNGEEVKPTNGDRIRQGSDEELIFYHDAWSCDMCIFHDKDLDCKRPCEKTCFDGRVAWLRAPAKSEADNEETAIFQTKEKGKVE